MKQDGKQGKLLRLHSPQPILLWQPWDRFIKLRGMEDTVWKPWISLKHSKDNKHKPHNLPNEAPNKFVSLKSQRIYGYLKKIQIDLKICNGRSFWYWVRWFIFKIFKLLFLCFFLFPSIPSLNNSVLKAGSRVEYGKCLHQDGRYGPEQGTKAQVG